MSRIISRLFLNARMGEIPNGAVTSSLFQRTCERLGHAKLDIFFNQWVYGAGCPRFQATQRFNKKKLVVEMMIKQVQSDQPSVRDLEKNDFMRDVKEEIRNVYAGVIQPVFTGSMTIRIHEADGTPYEHIVEIKEGVTKFDIPYNTKYKRLKRNKRQKERAAAVIGSDGNPEAQEDVLLYCLGDVLQSEEEIQQWRLADWSKEDEERMGQESYEWIRMDADFEWICKLSLVMPGYMYLSQLQQDRDVIAQLEVRRHTVPYFPILTV
jgi:transcription initiation factor TFIID subunit 2